MRNYRAIRAFISYILVLFEGLIEGGKRGQQFIEDTEPIAFLSQLIKTFSLRITSCLRSPSASSVLAAVSSCALKTKTLSPSRDKLEIITKFSSENSSFFGKQLEHHRFITRHLLSQSQH